MLGIVVYAAAGPEPIALMMVVPGEIGHSGRCAHDGIHWHGCSDVVGDVMHFTFFSNDSRTLLSFPLCSLFAGRFLALRNYDHTPHIESTRRSPL